MKYVQFVRDKYAVRLTVPPELRDIIGKRELVEPLGADKKVAERRAHGVIAGFLAQIEDARERLKLCKPTLGTAAKVHYRDELALDAIERRQDEQTLIKLRSVTQPRRATLLRLVASGQIVGDEAEALIGYAADALVAKGMAPDVSRADLLRALAEVQLDAMAQFEARDRGVMTTPEPKSPLLTQPDPEPIEKPARSTTGATLDEILVAFHQERTAGNRTLAEKTMEEHKVAVRMLQEFLGGDVPARSITREDVLAYKRALVETPSRYGLRFKGLTLPQAIKANKKLAKPFPTLDPQTINMKWLSHVSTIFKWAANNGYVTSNPAAGVRVDEGKGYKE